MDVFTFWLFFLLLLQHDSVCGTYLCTKNSVSWTDGMKLCLAQNGTMVPSSEVESAGLKSTAQVWIADYFDSSSPGPDMLCGFKYLEHLQLSSEDVYFLSDCLKTRNYFCHNSSGNLQVLSGTRDDSLACGNVSLQEINSTKWEPGYFWTPANSTGKFIRANNFTELPSSENSYCGEYKEDARSFFSNCSDKNIFLCFFNTSDEAVEDFNNNCISANPTIKTSSTTIGKILTTETTESMTPSNGDQQTISKANSMTPENVSINVTQTSSVSEKPRDTTAAKSTEGPEQTATISSTYNTNISPKPMETSSGYAESTSRENSLVSTVTVMSRVLEGSTRTRTTKGRMKNADMDIPKQNEQEKNIGKATGISVGLGVALIGVLVALLLVQRRYKCIRCLKRRKEMPSTASKLVHTNPSYNVIDDLLSANSKPKTNALSVVKETKYENVMSDKNKEPQDIPSITQNIPSFTQNSEYSTALDVNGPDKTGGKFGENSYKENEQSIKTGINASEYSFALDTDGPNITENEAGEHSYKENEYDTTKRVVKAPSTDENVYNITYTSDLEDNVYNKTNGRCIRENVYDETGTADDGENVYNKTFNRNMPKVQVPSANEYRIPLKKVSG